MKHRIELDSVGYNHDFSIHNGSVKQHFTWWEFRLEWEERCKARDLDWDDLMELLDDEALEQMD